MPTRVTLTSCFVYKVIRDLEAIDHLCMNPICRIGLINKNIPIERYVSKEIVLYRRQVHVFYL